MSDVGPDTRRLALDTLTSILDRNRPLDEVLDGLPNMDGRDRGFVRLLLATTLRRLGQTDDLIDRCMQRPLPGAAKRVRHLLRLGTVQMMFLDTPPHAAVSTVVGLAPAKFRPLVNGILRRLDREGRAWRDEQDAPRLNTPDWLWEAWTNFYGTEITYEFCAAHLTEADLDLTIKNDASTWSEKLGGSVLPSGTVRCADAGRVPDLPGFTEGAWWVQDAAAALPARLLGDVADKRVLDLCAAPGGKTAQLAAAGARVTALDRSAKRLDRLRENLLRLGLEARTETADAATWTPEAPFDAVLLDAPCSATGTLRRHPDVAHHKSTGEVSKLSAVQDRLLRAALDMVKPGGRIIFCTCSLQPEKGARRIDALLAETDRVVREPVRAEEIGGLTECVTPDGDLRTLPCHLSEMGGMDGFFAARLVRRS